MPPLMIKIAPRRDEHQIRRQLRRVLAPLPRRCRRVAGPAPPVHGSLALQRALRAARLDRSSDELDRSHLSPLEESDPVAVGSKDRLRLAVERQPISRRRSSQTRASIGMRYLSPGTIISALTPQAIETIFAIMRSSRRASQPIKAPPLRLFKETARAGIRKSCSWPRCRRATSSGISTSAAKLGSW
jgi:hypothetical protein